MFRYSLRTLLILLFLVLVVAAAAGVESLGEGWGTLIGITVCLPASLLVPVVVLVLLFYRRR